VGGEGVSGARGAPRKIPAGKSRIPADSFFYNRIIPLVLIVLAIATTIFVLIAAGILLGVVPFR
jgi:hypothetical protein